MFKRLVITLACTLAALGTVGADHSTFREDCDALPGLRPLGVHYVPADAEETTYPVYVTLDAYHPDGVVKEVWIYAESNGVTGLQRHDDWCYSYAPGEEADTIIF